MDTLTRKRAKYGFFNSSLNKTCVWTQSHSLVHACSLWKKKAAHRNHAAAFPSCPQIRMNVRTAVGGKRFKKKKLQPFATFKTAGRTKKIIAWLCLLHPTPPLRSQERRTSPFPRIQGVAAQNYLKDTPPLPFPSPGISSSKSMSSCPSSSLLSDPGIFIS